MNWGHLAEWSGLDVTTQALPGLLVSGTVGLTWPVFTGLSTVYAVRDARAQFALAEETNRDAAVAPGAQPVSALLQVLTAWLTVEAVVAVANQAKKQPSRMADGVIGAGVGNAIELGDASRITIQAQQAQRASADFALAQQRATFALLPGRAHQRNRATRRCDAMSEAMTEPPARSGKIWIWLLSRWSLWWQSVLAPIGCFSQKRRAALVTAKVTRGDVTQVVNATGTIQPLLSSRSVRRYRASFTSCTPTSTTR